MAITSGFDAKLSAQQKLRASLGMEHGQIEQPAAAISTNAGRTQGIEEGTVKPELPSHEEIHVDAAQAVAAARTHLSFLAGLAIPLVFRFNYPPVFLAVWAWLLEAVVKTRTFSRLVLGFPRGFGKTTFVKLFCLWIVLFTNRKFILVVCETAAKAESILADIADMLDERNIKGIFGDWRVGLQTDRQDLKKFAFRGRAIVIMGVGASTSIRGIVLKNERPDIMIFDDIQSRTCADSLLESEKLESWLYGTAMKAKSPFGCLFLYIGNMYPTKYAIIRKLKYNPTWTKFIVGGILADGTSLWEEVQPISQLLEEFEVDLAAGRPELFYSEVLNDENASVNNLIQISELPQCPVKMGDVHSGNFIVIDPAGSGHKADSTSIGYFEIHDGKPVMMLVKEDRMSPGDTIKETLKIALGRQCRTIVCESTSYQATLLYWFTVICAQYKLEGLAFEEVYSNSLSKVSRILQMFKSLKAGEVFYHPDTAPLVNLQISQFNPLRKDNVDGILDLLVYSTKVIDLYGTEIAARATIEAQEFAALGVIEQNWAF